MKLDGTPVTPLSQSDAEIRLQMPKHDNGYALVEIGNATAEFLYLPPRLQDLPAGYITTVAGVGQRTGLGRPAVQANVHPHGIAFDASGNIVFGAAPEGRILRVGADGILRSVTGGFRDPDTDGRPISETYISGPRSVGFDAAGNMYVAEQGSHRLHRVDSATGIVTTLCGTGVAGFSGDGGPSRQAMINEGNYLAVAADGTVYFLDFNNARIRRVTPGGIITTIAGTGVSGSDGDGGPATAARLEMKPNDTDAGAIALDPRGILYFGETHTGRIRRIDLATNVITTLVTFPDDSGDGREWPQIRSIALDPAGDLYVGVFTEIIKVTQGGNVVARWGKHKQDGFSVDGTALANLQLGEAIGLAIEHDGNLLFSDGFVSRLRRMNFASGRLETVAGSAPNIYGVPGPAAGAVLDGFLDDLAFMPNGDLLYSDAIALYVFRIDPAGNVTTVGGSGTFFGGSWVGPVLGANFSAITLEPDSFGGYYFSDTGSIGYVDPDGIGHSVAGMRAQQGFSGDGGPAIDAGLLQPWDVALDANGNLFIADSNNNRVRRIDKGTGIITTIAGSGSSNGLEGYGRGRYCGDGGPAVQACLNTPMAVAVAPDGSVFVSDIYNERLRRIDTSGTITTFAQRPTSKLVIDSNGVIFATASSSVDRFRPDGHRSSLTGDGPYGFSGDGGPALTASINAGGIADGIAIDREGNLFFRDGGNKRIRAIRFGAVLAPPAATIEITRGSGQAAALGNEFSLPMQVTVRGEDGVPEPSVRIEFHTPESGPSCVLPDGTRAAAVSTDRAGNAQISCRAWGSAGTYSLSATPAGSTRTVTFFLTNSPPPRRRAVQH